MSSRRSLSRDSRSRYARSSSYSNDRSSSSYRYRPLRSRLIEREYSLPSLTFDSLDDPYFFERRSRKFFDDFDRRRRWRFNDDFARPFRWRFNDDFDLPVRWRFDDDFDRPFRWRFNDDFDLPLRWRFNDDFDRPLDWRFNDDLFDDSFFKSKIGSTSLGFGRNIPITYRPTNSLITTGRNIPVQYIATPSINRRENVYTTFDTNNDWASNSFQRNNDNFNRRENRTFTDDWPPKRESPTRKRTSLTIYVRPPRRHSIQRCIEEKVMIELSSASTSSSFPSMGLVSSPPRSVCSTTNTSNSPNVVVQKRLHKFSCSEIEKLKQKYRIQHTSCFTHLQTLLNKNRISKCRECGLNEQCRICLECSLCLCRYHAQNHARLCSHPLAIDIKRLFVHCYICGDVQYDSVFERARRKIILLQQNPSNISSSSSMIGGICGLLNLGNTCFMNSVLQAFVHAPVLRDCFLSEKQHHCESNDTNHILNNCIMCQLRRLYHHVHQAQTTNEPFVPSQLLYLIWTHENHLAGFEEQDAQELLMALFNIIHSQNSNDDTNDEKSCSCIIDRFFKGALQSEITCSQCGSVSTKNDLVRDISLQLPFSSSNDESFPSSSFSLENCLWRFTHSETLSNFYCDTCQMSMTANIKLTISQAPIVACFHLKRFQYVKKSRSKMRKKISAHISFPDELDLTPYMTITNLTKENNKYYLFAVISHFGSSVETGHYMCYVKLQLQNRWFRCDDHCVCEVSAEEVFKSECYLLFYQRIIVNPTS
ncbi:unnamed protein product [Rotaria sp. Silwood1]|nr:unnamed protein product [Rotaria sp. Silwood1]CAF1221165.1 unnamed protein product [Rotaria sp. Silwood1]CAF3516201.1 unnamed protein product [Rotaria sp. Silwood1]